MSLLQMALHAMPPGSIVTKDMMASNAEMNKIIDSYAARETALAKKIQIERGCSWSDAISEVVQTTKESGQ